MRSIIITLIFVLLPNLKSDAQDGIYSYTFHGINTAYRKVTPYTGNVDYTFKNGEVKKISLHPTWNASDCKNVVIEVPEEKIKEFCRYSTELKKILLKYREWKEIALKNKVKEYEKNIDSLLTYIPEYEGAFMYNDKWYFTKDNVRFFHSFCVSEMGIQLIIMKTNMTAFALKDSHGLWDDLKMMSGAGTEQASLRVCYFSFNNEEDLQSFIDAVDVERIRADIKTKKERNRNLDALFQ